MRVIVANVELILNEISLTKLCALRCNFTHVLIAIVLQFVEFKFTFQLHHIPLTGFSYVLISSLMNVFNTHFNCLREYRIVDSVRSREERKVNEKWFNRCNAMHTSQ